MANIFACMLICHVFCFYRPSTLIACALITDPYPCILTLPGGACTAHTLAAPAASADLYQRIFTSHRWCFYRPYFGRIRFDFSYWSAGFPSDALAITCMYYRG
jgi:hypothetical protein